MDKASETMTSCTLEETLQRLNVSAGTTFQASLFRSKASGKLLFLEAGKDLVDVLLSFLLLPVGTIIHMLTKGMQVKPVAVGISSIFESVPNLSASDLQVAKAHQTRPRVAAFGCSSRSNNLPMLSALGKASILPSPFQRSGVFGDNNRCGNVACQSLAATPEYTTRRGYWGPTDYYRCGSIGCQSLVATSKNTRKRGWGIKEVDLSTVGFVKANTTFIVTDNLEIMPLTTNKNLNVLSKLNVDSLADLEGNDITVSITQILQLLHSSLTSITCLNEVFGKSMVSKFGGIRRLQSRK